MLPKSSASSAFYTPDEDPSNTPVEVRVQRRLVSFGPTMILVPNQEWRIHSLTNIRVGSKLVILSDVQNHLGREFTYSEHSNNEFMFQCDNCSQRAGPRAKGLLKLINGNVIVQEYKHPATCKPVKLDSIPPALPENSINQNK